jgi:hypothetical protein
MTPTTINNHSFVPEHYNITIKLSKSQYQVLQTISQVKAMSIEAYCQWSLIQNLENDIELHFRTSSKNTKHRLLDGLLQNDKL